MKTYYLRLVFLEWDPTVSIRWSYLIGPVGDREDAFLAVADRYAEFGSDRASSNVRVWLYVEEKK